MTLLDSPPTSEPKSGKGRREQLVARLGDTWQAARRWESGASDRIVVALLIGLALALRVPRLGIRYWGDEAISVGIAGRPLPDIPHYLAFDGSPPLWYVLLHWWMQVFGHSEVATHSFSLIISLVGIPVAWWCGARLFGRPGARAAALLASVSPYMAYYGTETRMYALLGVLSMVAVTAFIRCYRQAPIPQQQRAAWWTDPAKRWLVLAVISSEAVLYTHNWGLFLVGVLLVTGLLGALRRRDRTRLRRVLCYGLAVALGYLPWVPNFLLQLRTTGAPWAPHPQLGDLIVDPLNVGFSAASFVVVTGIGIAVVAKARAEKWRFPRRAATSSAATAEAQSPTPALLSRRPARHQGPLPLSPLRLGGSIVGATVVVGWIASQLVHAWSARYLGVAVVPSLVVLGGLFAEHRVGRRCLLVVAASLAATSLPVVVHPSAFADSKSNVAAVDGTAKSQLKPGDLVVTALAELPIIAYYLPPGLRYATPLGVVRDPRVIDWRHLPTRLQTAVPAIDLAAVLASVPVGGHVLVINPITFTGFQAPTQYSQTVSAEGVAINQDIILDPNFQSILLVKARNVGAIANPVEGVLYVRTGEPANRETRPG